MAGVSGQVGMIESGASSGGLSLADCLRHGSGVGAPWVGASELRVAAEVDYLLVGQERRPVAVPAHGRITVAWKSRSTGAGDVRPVIVAVGRDGAELSRLGLTAFLVARGGEFSGHVPARMTRA